MRINNNIMALNAHRQLAVNQTNASKSMERLSSGMRINRAGDDAAGLAISEKMRGQIRGLKQAQRNAQDGISLIQTAEGALNEIHAILQRMRELATQSATDTNTEVDRGEIQKEIDQLAAEITRIAETTEFNTQNLLGGSFQGTFHIGANEGQNVLLSINAMDSQALGVAGNEGVGFEVTSAGAATVVLDGDATFNVVEFAETVDVDDSADTANTLTVQYGLADADGNIVAVSEDGLRYWALDSATAADELSTATIASDTSSATATAFVFADPVISGTVTSNSAGDALTGTTSIEFASNDVALASGTYTVVDDTHALVAVGYGLVNSKGELVAVGNGNDWTTLGGDAMFSTATALAAGREITVSSDGGIDVSSQEAADAAITTINEAIETVSAERSKLGAMQNRLEHTIANLGTSAENLQAAESRIRDLDMAEEIMAFTKNNILQQAATAMLAQANMAPQSVLQLLG